MAGTAPEVTGTKSARTRRQVIDGALRALRASGVHATTTRKIAEEAEVRLATLHYHFDSKTALLLAVLEHLIDDTTTAMRGQTRGSADIAGCIEETLRAAWRFLMHTRELQIVQYELTLYALREGAEWLSAYQYDAYAKLYHDILSDTANRTGELDAAGCAALGRFMLAGIDGLLLQELAKPNRARSIKGIEALIEAAKAYSTTLQHGSKARRPRASDVA